VEVSRFRRLLLATGEPTAYHSGRAVYGMSLSAQIESKKDEHAKTA
jgi:hypothetical protein